MAMEAWAQIHGGMQEKNFSRQLSATVRNVQWSYAIFWANPVIQQGVLAWRDGYYNGDIKTRKTTQPMEFIADQIGLQRSEQLRELYDSLSADVNNQQTTRPSASLSPEDLTPTEWLPGRALASNRHIWLNNAQSADSKTFSRSLLSKIASIQTVVRLPFMDGVLELGTTENVSEDPSLLQQITATFWELPVPVCSEQSISNSPIAEKEHQSPLEDILSPLDFNFPYYALNEETRLIHDKAEEQNGSPDASSNDYRLDHHDDDDSFMMEGLPQVQSLQMMDDETSNCLHGSYNSSDCVSFANPPVIISSPLGERIRNHALDYLEVGNYARLTSLDLDGDETHYKRTLSAVLRNSKGPTSMSCLFSGSRASSFMFK